jgi:DNA excision repair protein ERCC-2
MAPSNYHFAHESIREGQRELADAVYDAVNARKSLFADAPTGSGKTAAVLCPAITYAIRHNKKVVFLTSRQTQHEIAIKTIRSMSESEGFMKEFKKKVIYSDIIAKKSMCALYLPALSGSDFVSYCKTLRDHDQCENYSNTKTDNGLTIRARHALKEIDMLPEQDSKTVKQFGIARSLCPYELAIKRMEDSNVIIADYNHLFHPRIRKVFLSKLRTDLSDIIIICDEAHNLPHRIRSMISSRISNYILDRAIREAEEYESENGKGNASETLKAFLGKTAILAKSFGKEDSVGKDAILKVLRSSLKGYEDESDLRIALEAIADYTRSKEKPSFCSTISQFIEDWDSKGDGMLRMVKQDDKEFAFVVKALDPGEIAGPIICKSHSFIAVSGTLRPLEMFSKLLGADEPMLMEVKSPFPKENRLDIIAPFGTTKYDKRTQEMTQSLADTIENSLANIPGNVIVFFPSYYLMESISARMRSSGGKKLLMERRMLAPEQKKQLLSEFKSHALQGAALFSVVSGSFGEGIDLPGNLLRGVIVIGLPFEVPDLETKSLIEYYTERFGKGWEYAYIYPAFNRIFQNAGRLIRTAEDRGVVMYVDTRYSWSNYKKLLDTGSAVLLSLRPDEMPKLNSELAVFYGNG